MKRAKHLIIKYIIGIISLVCAIVLVYRGRLQTQQVLSAGEIAFQYLRAQIDFVYIDKEAAEALRAEAAGQVPGLYYLDQAVREDALKKIEAAVDDDAIKTNLINISTEILNRGIITSSTKIKIISGGKDTISLKDPVEHKTNEINVDKFIVQEELDSVLANRLKAVHPFDRSARQAMQDVLIKVLDPNVVYDAAGVEERKRFAAEQVKPVYKEVKKGQTIIRRGDPVTDTHIIIMAAQTEELNKAMPGLSRWYNAVGTVLFVGIFFFILVTYLQYHQPEIFSCNIRLFLLAVIIISTLLLTRLISHIPLNPDKPFWQYFIIIPMCSMLIAIMMDKELAIITSMLMSVLVTVVARQSIPYTATILFGCIVSIQSAMGLLHRWEFIRAGIFTGIAYVLAILMVNLLKFYSQEILPWRLMGYQALGGFVSGLGCAMIVSICLPILEKIFNVTTNIRLLELSDLNHPLLKRMITEAPGTYHHSIVVSNMAEDAAAAIGANSLLAKVGGYFHDIGKITKPEYFVENAWFEEESRHEKLLPTMSNLVITAHVKDGNQLANRYRLPNAITDIINEHHGTSLVYYFYKQAEISAAVEGTEVREADFRYPGPRPHTKESGIILLADAIEAASKTLVKPTPPKIEELVKDISNEKINDGQLDECGLTFSDINKIRERFTHILTGILHKRVEYPEKNENKNNQSS